MKTALLVIACLILSVQPCAAEWFADVYVGTAFTDKDDIALAVIDKRRRDVASALKILQRICDPADQKAAVRDWFAKQWRQRHLHQICRCGHCQRNALLPRRRAGGEAAD